MTVYIQGLRLMVANYPQTVKIQFWLIGFVLSLAILASKNCKALEYWTENKDENKDENYSKANQENKTCVTVGHFLCSMHMSI